jgi:hypothetical protein
MSVNVQAEIADELRGRGARVVARMGGESAQRET